MPDRKPIVARLVYASESAIEGGIYTEMERIREAALRHNIPLQVYTALLYQSGWFVQWKEGPGEAIQHVMAHVHNDRRHRNLRVVHSSRGPRLLAGPWSMAVVQCDETREDMTQRVARVRRRMDEGEQYSPPAVWRQLSTPLRHPGAAEQADPDKFQRITVCSASGQDSFHLVEWLAQVHAQPVVHRRFAGSGGIDCGTDYVDFEDDERIVRTIAMARNGLTIPLTRAFLCDDSHVVLLLTGDPARDLPLLHRLTEACSGGASVPAVIGVARRKEAHAQPFSYAHGCGLIYLDATADPENPKAIWEAIHPYLCAWRDAANSSVISRPGVAQGS